MTGNDIVLSVRNVSKCFEMYEKPVHRLYQTLFAGHKKFYKEFWALRDINFEVRRGECVGIIGRNGAGKSTLLQIITGTLAPTTGEVKLKGRVAALLELGSGFNPEFTGRENVYLNGSILGLTKEEIDARYDEILAFADIGEFIDQPVKTYSSGMMVRLAFAVNAFVSPDVLIVDEALAVGDVLFQQKCISCLKERLNEGLTILFVSHDLGMVRTFCKKAIYLKQGQVACSGVAEDVVNDYWNDVNSKELPKCDVAFDPGTDKRTAAVSLVWHDAGKVPNGGHGEIRFTAFDLYCGGQSVGACVMGDEVIVAVSCVAEKDIPEGCRFGFVISDPRGVEVVAANMYVYESYMPELAKRTRFVVSASFKMPVLPGRYFLSYSLRRDYDTVYYYAIAHKVQMFDVLPAEWWSRPVGGFLRLEDLKFGFITGDAK